MTSDRLAAETLLNRAASAVPSAPTLPAINVEKKLFQNRYRVDSGRPHIRVKEAAVCERCEPGNVDWNYPRGGFGILFKFG